MKKIVSSGSQELVTFLVGLQRGKLSEDELYAAAEKLDQYCKDDPEKFDQTLQAVFKKDQSVYFSAEATATTANTKKTKFPNKTILSRGTYHSGHWSVEQLADLLADALVKGHYVRPVGTGRAFSDVNVSLAHILRMDRDEHGKVIGTGFSRYATALLASSSQALAGKCVQFKAGALIRNIADDLHEAGLSFLNITNADTITYLGAAQTGSHGSGIGFGPISDDVRALRQLIVISASEAEAGDRQVNETWAIRYIQLEPEGGISDPQAFAAQYSAGDGGLTLKLRQNTEEFKTIVAGCGLFGIITDVVIEAAPAYRILEERQRTNFVDLHKILKNGSGKRVEIWVNPYNKKWCVTTERSNVGMDVALKGRRPDSLSGAPSPLLRRTVVAIANYLPFLLGAVLDLVLNQTLPDGPVVMESTEGLTLGARSQDPADGHAVRNDEPEEDLLKRLIVPEFHIGIDDMSEVEPIIQLINGALRDGDAEITAPYGVRLVKATDTPMASMYKGFPSKSGSGVREFKYFMAVEVPILSGTKDVAESLGSIHAVLTSKGLYWRLHAGLSTSVKDYYAPKGPYEQSFPRDVLMSAGDVYATFNASGAFRSERSEGGLDHRTNPNWPPIKDGTTLPPPSY